MPIDPEEDLFYTPEPTPTTDTSITQTGPLFPTGEEWLGFINFDVTPDYGLPGGECPEGSESDGMGNCVPVGKPCGAGFQLDGNGNCVPIETTCPDGYTKDANGNCIKKSNPVFQPYIPPSFFPSTPSTPPTPPPPPPPPVKTATPQYVLFNDDETPIEIITDLLFENIGGQELLKIARYDTVNGQKIAYQPIKNLNILTQEYNPNNLVRLQNTSDKFFANYTIKLSDRTPNVGNGPNGENVYLDTNGNLIIELVNSASDEQVEIQITLNGTIYEVGI